jgi:hypothetical protein
MPRPSAPDREWLAEGRQRLRHPREPEIAAVPGHRHRHRADIAPEHEVRPPALDDAGARSERRANGRMAAIGIARRKDPHADVGAGVSGGSTNVVSEKFISLAIACIVSSAAPARRGRPRAGCRRRWSVKTS